MMMSHLLLRRQLLQRRCESGSFGFIYLRSTISLPSPFASSPSPSSLPDDCGSLESPLSYHGSERIGMLATTTATTNTTSNRFGNYDLFMLSSPYFCRSISINANIQSKVSFSVNPNRSLSTWEGRDKRSLAIERNKKLESLGGQGKWKEILYLYKKESEDFNYINYATTMVQLGRISSSANTTNPMDTTDPIFLKYMNDLATKIETRGLDYFETRHIANIVNSIGKMELRSNRNIKRIIEFTTKPEIAKEIITQGDMRHISLICWGIAKIEDTENFTKFYCHHVEPQLIKLIKEKGIVPQDFSNLAYTCAEMDVLSLKLFTLLEKGAVWFMENSMKNHDDIQNVPIVAWASSTNFGIYSPNLFANIERYSTWLVENGNPQDIANTALAFTTQGIPSKKFFGSLLMNNLDTFLRKANNQAIINVCYSIAILDLAREYEEGFLMLWSKALGLDTRNVIEEWTQLVQSYAFVTASGMKVRKPKIPTDVDLAPDISESKAQAAVSRTLTDIGFQHQQEVSPFVITDDGQSSTLPPGMLAIDFACSKRKIAIEYDGPKHFLIELPYGDVSRKANGSTTAKRRFLKRLGWKVYNIHCNDWDMLYGKGKEAKQALLRSMLNS